MSAFSIDHLIVYTFLAATLLIGLWAGRGIKDIRDYAIANREFGTGVLAMTILATYITGSKGIGYVGYVVNDGILPIFSILLCGAIITFLFIAWYIAPNIQYFKGCLTFSELMGQLYGEGARFWMGILGTCYSIALVALQMIWLGYVGALFNLSSQLSIFLGGFFLVLYAARGGMKAVAITDVLQFIAILVFIPLVAYVVLYQVGGIKQLFSQVPTTAWDVLHHPSLKDYVVYCIWDLFPAFPLSFPFIQRMLMAKDKHQLVNSYYVGLSFLTVFYLLLTLIGLAAIVLRATSDVNIPQQGSNVFVYLVKNYLPPGAQGIIGVGFIAGVMSTADSFLHTAGLALAHDVIQPRAKRKIDALRLAQYLTFCLGLIALALALFYKVLPRVQYGGLDLGKGLNFITEAIALVFTIPLVAGIMGLKPEERSFVVSSVTTVVVFVFSRFFLSNEFIIPVSIVTNAFTFFGTHYLLNRGFAVVKRSRGQQASYIWHPSWEGTGQIFSNLLPTPSKLLRYSKDKVAKYGANPTLFAFFMSFSYMLPFFMESYTDPAAYTWLLAIRGMGALLCVGLLLKTQWPSGLLPYFPSYYHFCLLYCLPFVTTFFFLLEGGSIEWIVNVALSIMFLIVLTDWATFVGLSMLGVALAMGLYRLGIGPLAIGMDSATTYTLGYAVTFSTLIGLLFARRKEQRTERRQKMLEAESTVAKASLLQAAEEKDKALKTLQNTGIRNLLQVAKDLQRLPVTGEVAQRLHAIEASLIPMAFQLQNIDTGAQEYLRLQVDTVTIDQLLAKVREKLKENGITHPISCQQATKCEELACDPERLATLISNSVAALQKQTEGLQEEEKDPILLGLEDTKLHYPLPDVAEGYVKNVKALRIVVTTEPSLPALEPSYQPDLTTAPITDHPTTTQEIEQMTNERIVKAHYGYAEVAPNTFCYVIPGKIRKVRPKDMDKPYMEFGAAPVRANDLYKSDTIDAQAQEKEFLAAVAQRSKAEIGLVKMALELIKWYHGPASRHSGEPFYLHPLSVAQIVMDYNTDEPTILGALLHDTVEDTAMLLPHIETVFGSETAAVVDVVTHLQSLGDSPYKIKLSEEENLQMLSRIGNTRALYVKIADRLHNMRTIHARPYERQLHRAQETLDFFVPLAERIGLKQAAEELRSRCEEVLSRSPQTSSMRT